MPEEKRQGFILIQVNAPLDWPEVEGRAQFIERLEKLFGMRAGDKVMAMQPPEDPAGHGPGGIEMETLFIDLWLPGDASAEGQRTHIEKMRLEYPLQDGLVFTEPAKPFTNTWVWKVDMAARTITQGSGAKQTIMINGSNITVESGETVSYGEILDAEFRAKAEYLATLPFPQRYMMTEKAIEQIPSPVTYPARPYDGPVTYTEDTLFKVRTALQQWGMTETEALNAINSAQKFGILFRERDRSEAATELSEWRRIALDKWRHYRDNVYPQTEPKYDVARHRHAEMLARIIPHLLGMPNEVLQREEEDRSHIEVSAGEPREDRFDTNDDPHANEEQASLYPADRLDFGQEEGYRA